jgi:predicted dinucleotide-binding enzyme
VTAYRGDAATLAVDTGLQPVSGPEDQRRPRQRDGKSLTSSELLLRYIPEAMLVKAFSNIFFKHLLSLARPAGAAGRSRLPIAGEGGGDRIHRIPRVQRGRRGTAGR